MFVQRKIFDQFVAEFVRQAEKMKAGDPLDDDTTIGGTISEDHAKKVLGTAHSREIMMGEGNEQPPLC